MGCSGCGDRKLILLCSWPFSSVTPFPITQDSQQGRSLYDLPGERGVLFAPADYTRLHHDAGESLRGAPEWEKRKRSKTIALSVDSAESHKGWIGASRNPGHRVDYPILAMR